MVEAANRKTDGGSKVARKADVDRVGNGDGGLSDSLTVGRAVILSQECVDWASNWISGGHKEFVCTANDDDDDIDSRNTHEWPSKQGGLWASGRSRAGVRMMMMVELATSNWRRPCKSGTNEHIDKLSFLHASPAELVSPRWASVLAAVHFPYRCPHTHIYRERWVCQYTHSHTHTVHC